MTPTKVFVMLWTIYLIVFILICVRVLCNSYYGLDFIVFIVDIVKMLIIVIHRVIS